jgi:hypothetical protein
MHDHFPTHAMKIQGSSDREFGLVFAIVFLFLAFQPLLNDGTVRMSAFVMSGIFGVAALTFPKVLSPANRLWMKFGELLHRIVSPLALGIVFYIIVLPTGLILRLFSKDPLHLRFDPSAESYWIKREPPGPAAESLNNQF